MKILRKDNRQRSQSLKIAPPESQAAWYPLNGYFNALLYSIEDFHRTTLPPLLRPEMCFNASGPQHVHLKQTETQGNKTIRGIRLELRQQYVKHTIIPWFLFITSNKFPIDSCQNFHSNSNPLWPVVSRWRRWKTVLSYEGAQRLATSLTLLHFSLQLKYSTTV